MSVSQSDRDPVITAEIINGGKELFKRYGFKKTTMEDIARAVGKSKSALYYYFKTKEEIFEAILHEDIRMHLQMVSEEMKKGQTAAEKFGVFVNGMLSNVKEKAEGYSVFRAELYESARNILEIAEEKDRFVEHLLKDILLFGIRTGELKPMQSVEMDVWVNLVHSSLKEIGKKLFLSEKHDYFLAHLGFLANSLFFGIAAPEKQRNLG